MLPHTSNLLIVIAIIEIVLSLTTTRIWAFQSSLSPAAITVQNIRSHHRSLLLINMKNQACLKVEDTNDTNNDNNSDGGRDISCSPTKKTKMEHNSNEELSSNTNNEKGAIYITVGPQCAGKTTILKSLFETNKIQVDSTTITSDSNNQQQQGL